MIPFSAGELAEFRDVQDDAMQDTCKRLVYSEVADGYGNPTVTYTAGSAFACGVRMTAPREVQASGNVPEIDAWVRVPIGQAVDSRDRLRVTHRYGEDPADVDYELVGDPERGPSGLLLKCVVVVE